ncbi:glycerol-3-phosphate dehydrogenase/oxidase [Undibacterium luofuense]|uniref:Glycerol-3-phosphate dehydrogenase/oxidase n=1 Tax=Undibacterium luofuense TaxID=2828733 RepID=A0A941I6S3_9BURK|nr:glycerol-3-phosphate dehydrogenase/oxidase [Undibacterium luofuense]MBR7784212.1 glycerol-3-phosphate dehydrogenase/oxidase [Undibacterium luofuense]
MDIGIIGGGINGLCCAWQLAKQGHQVQLYERDALMSATSCASSKLLHGGLRYLENREFRLVREALRERDAWIKRAPHLAQPLRLVMPIYQKSRRPGWMIALGLFLYDHLAGKSQLPKAKRLTAQEVIRRDPLLKSEGLQGGYEFSDGQMDDHALGLWVAEQARQAGVSITEHTEIVELTQDGKVTTANGAVHVHDRLINVAGPWAQRLLQASALDSPYQLDLVRGSHLILQAPCKQAYLLEAPNDRRIFFVLPWQGNTLVGTTEVRQTLNKPIACSPEERSYLLNAWSHYFPDALPNVIDTFAGLRPLLRSAEDPSKATREYALHRTGKLVTVLGGKWTTSMALADKVSHAIY